MNLMNNLKKGYNFKDIIRFLLRIKKITSILVEISKDIKFKY